jgi:pyruvate decarboxylase
MADFTVGKYLAARLEQIGLKHYFMVPGDYNLVLLDELLTNENLQQIGCCNELNAAYAAEGYARANGAGAVFTTYNVGAYSALNGVAGAYAERLPVIFVSSGPNTNDPVANHIMHHTMGTHDFSDQYEVCRQVTCEAVRILHADNAPTLIDQAISTALRERKPVYIEIACNLSAAPCPEPAPIDTLLASGEREKADPAGRSAPALLRRHRRLPGTGRSAWLRSGGHAQRQGLLPRRPPAIRGHLLGRGEHPWVPGHRRLG